MKDVFRPIDGYEAMVRIGTICQEILESAGSPEKLRILATDGARFMQEVQDKMIDAGSITPEREDCHSKDDPLGFFESQLSHERFVRSCSTPEAKAAGEALRECVRKNG